MCLCVYFLKDPILGTWNLKLPYTLFIAFTGSSLAADNAGINPANTPITPEMDNPNMMLARFIAMLISAT
jgi:hypothetical protein